MENILSGNPLLNYSAPTPKSDLKVCTTHRFERSAYFWTFSNSNSLPLGKIQVECAIFCELDRRLWLPEWSTSRTRFKSSASHIALLDCYRWKEDGMMMLCLRTAHVRSPKKKFNLSTTLYVLTSIKNSWRSILNNTTFLKFYLFLSYNCIFL